MYYISIPLFRILIPYGEAYASPSTNAKCIKCSSRLRKKRNKNGNRSLKLKIRYIL